MAHAPPELRLWPDEPALSGSSLPRGVALALLIWLATRVVVWSATYGGAADRVRIRHGIEGYFDLRSPALRSAVADPGSALGADIRHGLHDVAPLLQWDSGHYQSIITDGYSFRHVELERLPREDAQFNIAFFPGYPLLCAALGRLIGIPYAMVLVANFAGMLAAAVIYAWARGLRDHATGLLCVTLVFSFPTACFYSYGYAESLTLLLVALALWLGQRRQWVLAALCCSAATACRPTALLLAPLLALLHWRTSTRPAAGRLAVSAGVLLGSVLGAAAYLGYLAMRFGSPSVYAHNLRVGWLGSEGQGSWFQLLTFSRLLGEMRNLATILANGPAGLMRLLEPVTWAVPLAIALCIFSVAAVRRVEYWFRPLLWLAPLIFLQRYVASAGAGEQHASIARYVAIAAPTFVVLAAWMLRSWNWPARCVLLVGFTLLQASWAFCFGRGDWAG